MGVTYMYSISKPKPVGKTQNINNAWNISDNFRLAKGRVGGKSCCSYGKNRILSHKT